MIEEIFDAILEYTDAAIQEAKPTADVSEAVTLNNAKAALLDNLQKIELRFLQQKNRLDHLEKCIDRIIDAR